MLTKKALTYCNIKEGARILDAGCGTGVTAGYLAGQYEGSTIYGADICSTSLTEAKKTNTAPSFIRAKIESLPFFNKSLDVIMCECVLSGTIMHESLNEFARLIKEGGYLILSDIYWKTKTGELRDGHMAAGLFTIESIISLIEGQGFHIIHRDDCSKILKRLAACRIMEQGKLPQIFLYNRISICDLPQRYWSNIGYFYLVAQKRKEKRSI